MTAKVTCSRCGKRAAIYFRVESGEKLCKLCFLRSVERKIVKTIRKYSMIEEGDLVLVGLSGGKDSLVLLEILSKLQKRYENFTLRAVTVDEGIEGYREQGLLIAKSVAKALGVQHETVSFKELYGFSLDEMVERASEKGLKLEPCTFCGVLRRKALNIYASRIGATKIATGHNLDDEAETALINLVRGEFKRIPRFGPTTATLGESEFVTRIKPLRFVPEKELALYAYLKGFPLYEEECRYVRRSMRGYIRDLVKQLDKKYPGTAYSIVSTFDKIAEQLRRESTPPKFLKCKICGQPATKDICRACSLLLALRG